MNKDLDFITYNVEIPTCNRFTSGVLYKDDNNPQWATTNLYSNQIIINNPDDYVGSIVRFGFSGFNIPVIGPLLIQTPVTDINKCIYSFTMEYNGIKSNQTFYVFQPQIVNQNVPSNNTPLQTFSGGYYFLFDYDRIVQIMNVALSSALANLKTKSGTGNIAAANTPFFDYDSKTQLISLYSDSTYFDMGSSTDLIKIFFNAPSYVFMEAIPYDNFSNTDPTGCDNVINIYNNHMINIKQITVPSNYNAIVTSQQFVSVSYMSYLKNITIKTTMPINKESFNNVLNTGISQQQPTVYQSILTDFLPDISQPQAGISSYKFIYNTPSLYKFFTFNTNNPLTDVSLEFSWNDTIGNEYPLIIQKGQSTLVKFMFIKKKLVGDFLANPKKYLGDH